MKASKVQELLQAEAIFPLTEDREIECACGADLMSDVMAFVKERVVLLTGLCTPAVVRTAELLDIPMVVFVRGKRPSKDMIELAKQAGIGLYSSKRSMFVSCGILFSQGLSQAGSCPDDMP